MYHKHRLPGIFSNYFELNNIVLDHDTRGSNDIHVTAVNNNYGRRSITHKASTLSTNLRTALKEYSSINEVSKKFKSPSAVRNHLQIDSLLLLDCNRLL